MHRRTNCIHPIRPHHQGPGPLVSFFENGVFDGVCYIPFLWWFPSRISFQLSVARKNIQPLFLGAGGRGNWSAAVLHLSSVKTFSKKARDISISSDSVFHVGVANMHCPSQLVSSMCFVQSILVPTCREVLRLMSTDTLGCSWLGWRTTPLLQIWVCLKLRS